MVGKVCGTGSYSYGNQYPPAFTDKAPFAILTVKSGNP